MISGYDAKFGPIGVVISTIFMIGVYRWWFRPEFEGMLKGNLPLGFLLGLIEVGFVLIPFAAGLFAGEKIQLKPISLTILGVSLMAGMGEELAFRGVFISTLMREWKNQNKFRNDAVISGIVFGLVHATNLFMGANPVRTLLQMVVSMCVGIIFSAIYMRSGSLLPCMFYHTVHDIIAIAASNNVSEEGIITGTALSWTDGLEMVLAIVMAVIALYILRAANNEEMRALWNRKWMNEKAETLEQNEV
ncbi:MAG: CPBP family intramembrane metalloprotease [Lachnospiraceae bacterium]|nr:CPBP family intramembrane metalloprotease [Lachnospiraceae bacterium]